MKNTKNWIFLISFLLLGSIILCLRTIMFPSFTPTPRSAMQTDLTHDMRTLCIGRLMIDIPARYYPVPSQNTVKVQSSFSLFNKSVSLEYPVTLDEYNQTVEARWQEINKDARNFHDLSIYKRPPEKLSPRPNGYILAYGFDETYGTKWVDGELIKVDVAIANDAIGYYWIDGSMFTIKSPGSSLATRGITDIINHLSSYDWSKEPTETGICLYQGFFEKYYAPGFEQVTLSIEFTDQFGFSLITKMGEGRNPNYPTELLRIGEELRSKPEGTQEDDFGRLYVYRVYRAADYKSPYFNGEEIVRSISSGVSGNDSRGWANEMLARWEVVGELYEDNKTYISIDGTPYTPKINYPDILFQMSVKTQTNFKPQEPGYPPVSNDGMQIPTEEEFFAVWDAMVNSIRFYPGALTPAPQQRPIEFRPGPSAQQITSDKQALDDFLGEHPAGQ